MWVDLVRPGVGGSVDRGQGGDMRGLEWIGEATNLTLLIQRK